MSLSKFQYLEVVERPTWLNLVVKRVDVSKIDRQKRNKLWLKLEQEFTTEDYLTRYTATDNKLSTI